MNVLYKRLHKYIIDTKNEIVLTEKKIRKKNADALDEEDAALSIKMQSEALTEIKILRKIKQALDEFEENVNRFTNIENAENSVYYNAIDAVEDNDNIEIETEDSQNGCQSAVSNVEETNVEETIVNDESSTEEEFSKNKDTSKVDFIDDIRQEENQGNVSVEFLGSEYVWASVEDVLPKVIHALMLQKPYAVSRLPWNESFLIGGKSVFSYNPAQLISDGTKLSNGLWVAKLNDKEEILALSNKLLEDFGFKDRLVFL